MGVVALGSPVSEVRVKIERCDAGALSVVTLGLSATTLVADFAC